MPRTADPKTSAARGGHARELDSPPAIKPAALIPRDAAAYIGFAEGTLKKWRCEGIGPEYVKHGKAVVYMVSDLDKFLAEHRVSA